MRSFLTVKDLHFRLKQVLLKIHITKRLAALIEDLLREGYKYVLTARFQSDPLEKRYGQYLLMSAAIA